MSNQESISKEGLRSPFFESSGHIERKKTETVNRQRSRRAPRYLLQRRLHSGRFWPTSSSAAFSFPLAFTRLITAPPVQLSFATNQIFQLERGPVLDLHKARDLLERNLEQFGSSRTDPPGIDLLAAPRAAHKPQTNHQKHYLRSPLRTPASNALVSNRWTV